MMTEEKDVRDAFEDLKASEDERTGELILTVYGHVETIDADMYQRYVADYGKVAALYILQILAEDAFKNEVEGPMDCTPTDRLHIAAPYGYED